MRRERDTCMCPLSPCCIHEWIVGYEFSDSPNNISTVYLFPESYMLCDHGTELLRVGKVGNDPVCVEQ